MPQASTTVDPDILLAALRRDPFSLGGAQSVLEGLVLPFLQSVLMGQGVKLSLRRAHHIKMVDVSMGRKLIEH